MRDLGGYQVRARLAHDPKERGDFPNGSSRFGISCSHPYLPALLRYSDCYRYTQELRKEQKVRPRSRRRRMILDE
jgi:hypothetical protein